MGGWGAADKLPPLRVCAGCMQVRFSGTIPAPPAAVWDILRNGSRRLEIDGLMDKSNMLEQLSPLISIWQFGASMQLLRHISAFRDRRSGTSTWHLGVFFS
eukprot:SAG11_NODE_19818_length_458_cov_1.142061_1_plen_100_part_10